MEQSGNRRKCCRVCIVDNKIVIHDNYERGPVDLREIEIVTKNGIKKYTLKKTRNNGYLFN